MMVAEERKFALRQQQQKSSTLASSILKRSHHLPSTHSTSIAFFQKRPPSNCYPSNKLSGHEVTKDSWRDIDAPLPNSSHHHVNFSPTIHADKINLFQTRSRTHIVLDDVPFFSPSNGVSPLLVEKRNFPTSDSTTPPSTEITDISTQKRLSQLGGGLHHSAVVSKLQLFSTSCASTPTPIDAPTAALHAKNTKDLWVDLHQPKQLNEILVDSSDTSKLAEIHHWLSTFNPHRDFTYDSDGEHQESFAVGE